MPAKGLGVQFDDELERMYDAYNRKRGSSLARPSSRKDRRH